MSDGILFFPDIIPTDFEKLFAVLMSSDGNHMTRLEGVKQEMQDLEAGFESLVNDTKYTINSKFNNINDQLKDTKENFTKSLHDIVPESISKVKDSIIEALREENFKLL